MNRYAWSIAQCRICHGHMGWKFTSTHRKLNPKKFWGISRHNIQTSMVIEPDQDDESEEQEETNIGPIM